MKKLTLLTLILLSTLALNAQVAVNTDGTAADNSAMLDVKSNTAGILIPRMTKAQRDAISAPATGLMIYQTDHIKGFYYWTGTQWTGVMTGGYIDNLTDAQSDTATYLFLGKDAGAAHTIGTSVTAVGIGALKNSTTQYNLVAIGDSALYYNGTGAINYYQAILNTAVGSKALYYNTTGSWNTATGFQALYHNTEGYYNTANGSHALYSNTTGYYNTASGSSALYRNTTGYSNVAIGINALYHNTTRSNLVAIGDSALYWNGIGAIGDQATGNTAVGSKALYSNTKGYYNTATGFQALYSDTTGAYNTATGFQALYENTTGTWNTANGYRALYKNTGNDNTANGVNALYNNTTGSYNTANGVNALVFNTTGHSNIAIGINALYHNTTRSNLVAVGDSALYWNGHNAVYGWDAVNNTAVGSKALYNNTTGGSSTATGYQALYENSDGYKNTATGYLTLTHNTHGYQNTAYGAGALNGNTDGDNNTAVGYNAYVSGSYNNSTAIGYNTTISGSNQIHLGNTSITEIKGEVDFSTYSDGRIKDNVTEDVSGLNFITRLRPVTYHINVDKQNNLMGITDSSKSETKYEIEKIKFSGFIAQEVEQAAKQTGYVFSGVNKPKNDKDLYSLSYAQFVVPLVKAVQELSEENNKQKEINSQQKELINELLKRIEKLENKNR